MPEVAEKRQLRRSIGSDADREAAIIEHIPLVRSLARQYANRGEPYDDLVQVGTVGLIKAVDRFDPLKGAALSTFATPTILGEIRRYFRDFASPVHLTRSLREARKAVRVAVTDLSAQLGRSPSVKEIAAGSGLRNEHVLDAMAADSALRPLSLSQPGNSSDGDDPLEIPTTDEGFAFAEGRVALDGHFHDLPERERRVLILRLHNGLSQSAIAAELGVSQMHVSRLIANALQTLRLRIGVC